MACFSEIYSDHVFHLPDAKWTKLHTSCGLESDYRTRLVRWSIQMFWNKRLKTANYQKSDQLAIYKHHWGVEPNSIMGQLQFVARMGVEPLYFKHSVTLFSSWTYL